VEQDEELPHILITFREQQRVTLRLRGYGEERILKPDGTAHNGGNLYVNPSNNSPSTLKTNLLLFGAQGTPTWDPDTLHSLHLEKHITFDGNGTARNETTHYHLIQISVNARLVMLEGSKITNQNANGSVYNHAAVHLNSLNYSNATYGSFYMYGGEITGNYVGGQNYMTPVRFQAITTRIADHSVFFKYGGSITENYTWDTDFTDPATKRDRVGFGTGNANVTIVDIEPGVVYELPEF
jgi:hypothetical protein